MTDRHCVEDSLGMGCMQQDWERIESSNCAGQQEDRRMGK